MAMVVLNAMDSADVGMIQQRCRPRLSREAFQRFGVARKIFRDELQGYVPPQLQVFRLVNHAHATAPELSQDAIVGDCLANHEKTEPSDAVMLGPPTIPVNWPVLIVFVPKLTNALTFCFRLLLQSCLMAGTMRLVNLSARAVLVRRQCFETI